MSARAILNEFESLGHNCEFGIVQRHFGLETVGLLRWGSIANRHHGLIHGLNKRLVGIADNLDCHFLGDEYISEDKVYGMVFHTHRHRDEIEADELVRREKQRIPYLAERFIEDVEDGNKIFVYHCGDEISLPEAWQLRNALRSIGPSTLLWVTETDRADQVGSVEVCGPYFLHGYIDRIKPPELDWGACSYKVWLQICENALRLRDQAAAEREDVYDLVAHRYWRLLINRPGRLDNHLTAIHRLEFRTEIGGANVATMAANWRASSEFPASVPREMGYNYEAHNVIDGVGLYDLWASDNGLPCWIGYDFETRPKKIVEIKITSRIEWPDQTPADFELQWSDDGSRWLTALLVTGAKWGENQSRTYDVFGGAVKSAIGHFAKR